MGKRFYEGVAESYACIDRVINDVRDKDGIIDGVLRIASIHTVGAYITSESLTKFAESFSSVLETFAQTERTVAAQAQSLADAMQKESVQASSISALSFYVPYAERFLPAKTRDFQKLLRIHAAGLRHVVDNENQHDMKTRAYHLSAELYLLQHSCHWFCKSRAVADARLVLRHQVNHQKVLDSVSAVTRSSYLQWLRDTDAHQRDSV